MRLPRSIEPEFVAAFLKHMDYEAAAREVGIIRSPRYFGRAMLQRPRVAALVAQEQEARRIRLRIDADFILDALMQQYARLDALRKNTLDVLATERHITTVLKTLGEHVKVKAFPAPGPSLAPREAIEITVVHVGDGQVGVKVLAPE